MKKLAKQVLVLAVEMANPELKSYLSRNLRGFNPSS